jgi:hypothetical protein
MSSRDKRPAIQRLPVEKQADLTTLRASGGGDFVSGIDDRLVTILDQLFLAVADIRQQLSGKQKSHLVVEEVAEATGKSPYTVRQYIRQGRIQAIRVTGTGPKGRLLVPREELAKLIPAGLAGQVPAALTEIP